MNIGRVSKLSGVSTKMIRYYEEMGVIPRAARSESGYRVYSESDVHLLLFLRNARDLGFSMKDTHELIGLWKNRQRASDKVRRLASKHRAELEGRVLQLKRMQQTLDELISKCNGDDRPECPILESLSELSVLKRSQEASSKLRKK